MNKWYEDYMNSNAHLPGWKKRRCMIRKMKIIHILNGKT